jgi:hypothetical protein
VNYFRSQKGKKANAPRNALLALEKPVLLSVVVAANVEAVAVDSVAAIAAMVAEGTEAPGTVAADEVLPAVVAGEPEDSDTRLIVGERIYCPSSFSFFPSNNSLWDPVR